MDFYGILTDIQRFSLHDGPGIRTSVFFKGCNLDCVWCHNPETIAFETEVLIDPDKCIGCGKCSDGCFSGARRTAGKRYTLEEVMLEISQDKSYYGEDGGVTLTGGEPACQLDFAAELLKICKQGGIGRAVETNLYYDESTLIRLASLCDVVMCDLKIWDESLHIKYTGAPNQQIKKNLKILSNLGVPFIVRTTVVPGINDTKEEISSIADFLSNLPNLLYYELLSYNSLGLSKRLEGKEPRSLFELPSKEMMRDLTKFVEKAGIPVRLDGVEII